MEEYHEFSEKWIRGVEKNIPYILSSSVIVCGFYVYRKCSKQNDPEIIDKTLLGGMLGGLGLTAAVIAAPLGLPVLPILPVIWWFTR